ncbi:MAG: hypothetical protein AAB500_00510 [Patescibacteria group bacterium]
MRNFLRRYFIIVFLVVLVIVLGYFYKSKISYEDPEQAAKAAAQELTERVGKLVLLPSGETPIIATVSDEEVLKNKAFFAEAERGDKVLIYTGARRAYLYRPSLNLVVNIAPVNLGDFGQSSLAPSEAGILPPGEF